MRREWLIVAAVLVPFAVLVAAWWRGAPEQARVALPAIEPETPRVAQGLRAEVSASPLQPSRAEDASVPKSAAEPPPALAAPIKAVTPEVQACFVDNDAHLHGRVEVTIAFEPTVDGRFTRVSVETALPSPELTACLEDVFAQMRFEPTGQETFEPARHTFIFDAPPR